MISTVPKVERRAMRRLMVAVAAAVMLAGCGYASEGPSPTSTTINHAWMDDGPAGQEGYQEEQGQRLQEEWERQQAEQAEGDYSPSTTSTTLP